MAISWDSAVALALRWCVSSVFVLTVSVPFPWVYGTGCGIRLYRFLTNAFPLLCMSIKMQIKCDMVAKSIIKFKLSEIKKTLKGMIKIIVRQTSGMALYANSFEPRHDKTNKMAVHPAKTQISLGIRPV